MNCPKCGNSLASCIDARQKNDTIYRRRKCVECGYRYSTIEITIDENKRLIEVEKSLKELLSHAQEIKERNIL